MRSPKPRVEIAAVNPRRGGAVLVDGPRRPASSILSAQAPGARRPRHRAAVLDPVGLRAASRRAVGARLARRLERRRLDAASSSRARAENARLRRDLDAARAGALPPARRGAPGRRGRDGCSARARRCPGVVGSVPVLLVERRAGVAERARSARARRDGVAPGSPLAVPAGLVGRVVTVGPRRLARAAAARRVGRRRRAHRAHGRARRRARRRPRRAAPEQHRDDLVGRARATWSSRPASTASIRAACRSAASSRSSRGSKLFLEIRVDAGGRLRAPDGRPAARAFAGDAGEPGGRTECGAVKVGRIALLLAAAAVLRVLRRRARRYRAFLPVDWFLLATAIVARSGDFVRAVLDGRGGRAPRGRAVAAAARHERVREGDPRLRPDARVGARGLRRGARGRARRSPWPRSPTRRSSALLVGAARCSRRSSSSRATRSGAPRRPASPAAALEAAWNFPWREWWKRRRLRRLR